MYDIAVMYWHKL